MEQRIEQENQTLDLNNKWRETIFKVEPLFKFYPPLISCTSSKK